jgi:hypothetical protein
VVDKPGRIPAVYPTLSLVSIIVFTYEGSAADDYEKKESIEVISFV